MRIRLMTTAAGPGGVHHPGEEHDNVDPVQVRELLAGKHAQKLARGETARRGPPENAARSIPNAEEEARRALQKIAAAEEAARQGHAQRQGKAP